MSTDRARFIVELDTAQAEAALARLRGGGAGVPGGGGGSEGGGTRPPTPSSPSSPNAPSSGGGGGFVELAAILITMKESIREIGNATTAFTDAANRLLLRESGLSEHGFERIRAAQSASAKTIDELGVAGAVATDEQMSGLYNANLKLARMRERGRTRVQAISDPTIMEYSAPFAAAMGAAAFAKWLGIELPGGSTNR